MPVPAQQRWRCWVHPHAVRATTTHLTDTSTLPHIDIGMGDIGILNYAYALEQLEAAFYLQVIATPYSGISIAETAYLTDIRDHEVLHRDFFQDRFRLLCYRIFNA
jgi:hypothetical protein